MEKIIVKMLVFRMEMSNFFNVYHFQILLPWVTVTSFPLCPVWPFGFVLNSFAHLSRDRNSCVSSFKGSAGLAPLITPLNYQNNYILKVEIVSTQMLQYDYR